MRIQSAIVAQLQLTTTDTYALVGTRTYWAAPPDNPTIPFVIVRKSSHTPMLNGFGGSRRFPGSTDLEILAYAKSQASAATIMDAVSEDLMGIAAQAVPITSPATSGAPYVNRIFPGTEEDLVSDEAREKGLFGEARTFTVDYDYR